MNQLPPAPDHPAGRVVYLTAGAGGMFCGSCMHDNTLVRALRQLGLDVQLVPTYTPIRTDEEDISFDRVFFGGVNVYLQQRFPIFRWLPGIFDRLLDQPRLLRWVASRGLKTDARMLGGLAVSMLRGSRGFQRKEVRRLTAWLQEEARPDLLVFSNLLIGGSLPDIRAALRVPTLVTLQGDDIFLLGLPEPYREQAFQQLYRLVQEVDGFLVHSHYYADFMAELLRAPRGKFHVVPLGVDTRDFAVLPPAVGERPPTVGYLARLAPEKGLHLLVEAFLLLRRMPGTEQARLRIAGWLGENDREYAEAQFQKLRAAGLAEAFEYVGSVDRSGKVAFLSSLDVLSVPTTYREPKGLFVFEALAAGVPVVQPEHGAFPELLQALGGGRLVRPQDVEHLAETLHELLCNDAQRRALGAAGRARVLAGFHAAAMAEQTLHVFAQHMAAKRK